jgi:thiol-disulfide isomerase/thioredoxin
LDTNANSSPAQKPWALWVALTLLAEGAIAVLYVLFAASSKPDAQVASTVLPRRDVAFITEAPPPMPTRTLRDAAGAETTLAAYQGQVMVLNLWATWCAPCMEEMPSLAALQRNFEGRINVVPISVDSEGERDKAISELQRLSGGALPFLQDMTRGVLFDAPAGAVTIICLRRGSRLLAAPIDQ